MPSKEKDAELQIIPHDSSAPIDMLGREDFIGQLITIVEILASNKKNASYAINGAWGTGKTWILESFERRIREFYQEGTTLNKYVVFHYNCWEYDYYSEPLIAIVAAILDQIDTLNLVKEEQKAAIKEIIKEIGISLLENASTIVKGKTGIDIQAIRDLFGLIIGCYRAVLGFNNEHWSGGYENVVTVGTLSVREYVLKFWKLLNLIQ